MAERTSLVRLEKEFDIEVDWRGFELHPETSPGGVPLTRRFSAARIAVLHDHLKEFAAGFGIRDLKLSDRLPNTRRALAMAEFARDQDKLDSFRALVMEAYWQEGKDIEDSSVLSQIAAAAGMAPDRAALAMDDPAFLGRVDAIREEAGEMSIGGIPTFIIGEESIEGCQPYEVLADASRRAGAAPKKNT